MCDECPGGKSTDTFYLVTFANSAIQKYSVTTKGPDSKPLYCTYLSKYKGI